MRKSRFTEERCTLVAACVLALVTSSATAAMELRRGGQASVRLTGDCQRTGAVVPQTTTAFGLAVERTFATARSTRRCERLVRKLCSNCAATPGVEACRLCEVDSSPCTRQQGVMEIEDTLDVSVTYSNIVPTAPACAVSLSKDGQPVMQGSCDLPAKIPVTVPDADGYTIRVPIGVHDTSFDNQFGIRASYGSLRGYLVMTPRAFVRPDLATADDILGLDAHMVYGADAALIGSVILPPPWRIGFDDPPFAFSCLFTGSLRWRTLTE